MRDNRGSNCVCRTLCGGVDDECSRNEGRRSDVECQLQVRSHSENTRGNSVARGVKLCLVRVKFKGTEHYQ